jgi:hypothetical protein
MRLEGLRRLICSDCRSSRPARVDGSIDGDVTARKARSEAEPIGAHSCQVPGPSCSMTESGTEINRYGVAVISLDLGLQADMMYRRTIAISGPLYLPA